MSNFSHQSQRWNSPKEQPLVALHSEKEVLRGLSEFDCLTRPDLLSALTILMRMPRRLETENFLSAVELCHRAVFLNLDTDPLIEEWASWPPRYSWLAAELSACEIRLKGGEISTHLNEELVRNRDRYTDDGYGYPSDIWRSYQRLNERKNIAQARMTLYELAAKINPTSLGADEICSMVMDSVQRITLCSKRDAQTLNESEYYQTIFSTPVSDAIAVAKDAYKKLLRASVLINGKVCYPALCHVDEPTLEKFFDGVAISVHQGLHELDDSFWQEVGDAQDSFIRQSARYPAFSPTELRELLEEGRCLVIQIRYHDEFVTSGFLMIGTDDFLSRTKDKLSQFGEMVLSPMDVHTWQFLNLANLSTLLKLRTMNIDWSMLLRDVITDVALSANREDVLGLVEVDNPATTSHARLGFRPLESRITFTSDGGSTAKIIRRSLMIDESE